MTTAYKLILKDVRCFAGQKEFNIRPLTFLVGENSTGKSTALGCFQVLSDFLYHKDFNDADFNSEPYQMGAFADIARRTRPLAETFELGFESENIEYKLAFMERENGSEPIIQQMEINLTDGEILFKKREPSLDSKSSKQGGSMFDSTYIEERKNNKFIIFIDEDSHFRNRWINYFDYINFLIRREDNIPNTHKKLMLFLNDRIPRKPLHRSIQSFFAQPKTYSFAPIRSKPERTYNPLKETTSPEGSDIPMVLRNFSTSRNKGWSRLKERLEKFGDISGLFSDIEVRKLGQSTSDPFQLQIKVRGPKSNLMDVGYGVSQILPILVRILTRRDTRFLLQQPEVHLHPKGQAELTSFLIDMKESQKNSFIIETHSDYMIDRARIEIMKGRLKPNDVSLIYLEPVGNKVNVHNIEFDSEANMINAPRGYRDFFLKEHDKLLGFGV